MTKQNEYAKKYYWSHREECRISKQKCNDKFKLATLQRYSSTIPTCAVCGEKDILVLCLDHINGAGEAQRKELNVIGGVSFYRKLKNQGYPDGFQVLCANCNLRKEMVKTRRQNEHTR